MLADDHLAFLAAGMALATIDARHAAGWPPLGRGLSLPPRCSQLLREGLQHVSHGVTRTALARVIEAPSIDVEALLDTINALGFSVAAPAPEAPAGLYR